MPDIYMIAIIIVLSALMIGLGRWASITIEQGSDPK